jgi:hypothetical protein
MFSGDLAGAEDHRALRQAHHLRPAVRHIAQLGIQTAEALEAVDPGVGSGGGGHFGQSPARDAVFILHVFRARWVFIPP